MLMLHQKTVITPLINSPSISEGLFTKLAAHLDADRGHITEVLSQKQPDAKSIFSTTLLQMAI